MKSVLGKKIGMTQIFDVDGKFVPVTVVEATPMKVVQIKTVETDGYDAIQVGACSVKESRVNKPLKGHFAKASVEVKKFLREFKVENVADYSVGQEITVALFNDGELVDAQGTSKGKGFTGTIRRYNQSRGPETHGSKYHRAGGSIGAASTPARVIKGMPMAGHMGHETVTVQSLTLVKVDAERNLLLIKGAVPGPKGGLVTISKAVKAK
jgi:large subunit ribosomal protein L3